MKPILRKILSYNDIPRLQIVTIHILLHLKSYYNDKLRLQIVTTHILLHLKSCSQLIVAFLNQFFNE